MSARGIWVSLILFGLVSVAQAQSLDDLARQAREAAGAEAAINREREERFVREVDRQKQLLDEARVELEDENARSDQLRAEYDQNENALAELETTLTERLGNLGELFGVVRQVAGDVQAVLDDSMITAQSPGRTGFISELSKRRELPTVPDWEREHEPDGADRAE